MYVAAIHFKMLTFKKSPSLMLGSSILKKSSWWFYGESRVKYYWIKIWEKKKNRKTHLRIIQQGRQWVESRIMDSDPIMGLEMDLVGSSKHLKM